MSVERYARRYGPYGATAQVHVVGGRVVTGELLAIDDSTLVIMEKQRVVVVPFDAVRMVGIERLTLERGAALYHARFRREATMRARYPHGLGADLTARLVARAGQQAPDTARAKAK